MAFSMPLALITFLFLLPRSVDAQVTNATLPSPSPSTVDCVGGWNDVDVCTATCGRGISLQVFSIETEAQGNGIKCEAAAAATRVVSCNLTPCIVHATHPALEIITIIVSFVMLMAYHAFWWKKVMQAPDSTVFGASRLARIMWINKMMGDDKNIILSIQTLRNSIMASSLVASSSLVLLAFLLTALLDPTKLGAVDTIPEATDPLFSDSLTSVRVKILLLSLMLFLSFIVNLQSIRLLMQAGFYVSVTNGERHDWAVDKLTLLMLTSSKFWAIGLRLYYLMVPLISWHFGTMYLFFASALLIAGMYYVDIGVTGPAHELDQVVEDGANPPPPHLRANSTAPVLQA